MHISSYYFQIAKIQKISNLGKKNNNFFRDNLQLSMLEKPPAPSK